MDITADELLQAAGEFVVDLDHLAADVIADFKEWQGTLGDDAFDALRAQYANTRADGRLILLIVLNHMLENPEEYDDDD